MICSYKVCWCYIGYTSWSACTILSLWNSCYFHSITISKICYPPAVGSTSKIECNYKVTYQARRFVGIIISTLWSLANFKFYKYCFVFVVVLKMWMPVSEVCWHKLDKRKVCKQFIILNMHCSILCGHLAICEYAKLY